MGIISHHAIVVTGTYEDWAERAHKMACSIFPAAQVSQLSPVVVNGTRSFCVFPDGSKEGWEASTRGDEERDTFIRWLVAQRYDDGSSPLCWAEVNYGECVRGDFNGAKVDRHAWQRRKYLTAGAGRG